MKKIWWVLVLPVCLLCCNPGNNGPDVSGVKVDVKLLRFDKDFFLLDTNHIVEGLDLLNNKYPGFTGDFIANILGLQPAGLNNPNGPEIIALKSFLRDYRPLKDSADKLFENFDQPFDDIRKGLQHVHYYFPKYALPQRIFTFIGPIDAFFQTSFGTSGDIITKEGLGIGLQLHLGSNFSSYKTSVGEELYPGYISKTFSPQYIAVNCMENIIDDMYEDKSTGRPLVEQMVAKGKRLYLLEKLLPQTPDHIKMRYTEKQMESAYKNEAVIWDFFLNNELLNNQEQNMVKNYIGESPKTQELGEDAPGNLGSFAGWQIVKKYMQKNAGLSLDKMMRVDAREMYGAAKYKPTP